MLKSAIRYLWYNFHTAVGISDKTELYVHVGLALENQLETEGALIVVFVSRYFATSLWCKVLKFHVVRCHVVLCHVLKCHVVRCHVLYSPI